MPEERADLCVKSEERLPTAERPLSVRHRLRRAQPLPEEHGGTAAAA